MQQFSHCVVAITACTEIKEKSRLSMPASQNFSVFTDLGEWIHLKQGPAWLSEAWELLSAKCACGGML